MAGAGDNLVATLQAAGSDDPNDPKNVSRIQAGYSALGSAVVNGSMSEAQADAIMVGAATMINPALGVAMGVALAAMQVLEVAMNAAFKELGWDANGGPPYNPCDNPPSGPNDPNWVQPAYPWGTQGNSVFQAGSFPAIASAVLARNAANYANCRPSVEVWTLLRQLAEIWNNAHDNNEQIWYVGQGGPIQTVPASGFGPAGFIQYDPFFRGTVQWDSDGTNRKTYLSNWNNAQPLPSDIVTSLRINMGPLKPAYVPKPPKQVSASTLHNSLQQIAAAAKAKRELAAYVKQYTGKVWGGTTTPVALTASTARLSLKAT